MKPNLADLKEKQKFEAMALLQVPVNKKKSLFTTTEKYLIWFMAGFLFGAIICEKIFKIFAS